MNADMKPVMTLNPYTAKLMNVEPLFRFTREWVKNDKRIDDIIKHIITNIDREESVCLFDEFASEQGMYLFLYDLKRMFEELAQCEISTPKQKGGPQ